MLTSFFQRSDKLRVRRRQEPGQPSADREPDDVEPAPRPPSAAPRRRRRRSAQSRTRWHRARAPRRPEPAEVEGHHPVGTTEASHLSLPGLRADQPTVHQQEGGTRSRSPSTVSIPVGLPPRGRSRWSAGAGLGSCLGSIAAYSTSDARTAPGGVAQGALFWEPSARESCRAAGWRRTSTGCGASAASTSPARGPVAVVSGRAEAFWASIWDYFEVRASTGYRRCWRNPRCPGRAGSRGRS